MNLIWINFGSCLVNKCNVWIMIHVRQSDRILTFQVFWRILASFKTLDSSINQAVLSEIVNLQFIEARNSRDIIFLCIFCDIDRRNNRRQRIDWNVKYFENVCNRDIISCLNQLIYDCCPIKLMPKQVPNNYQNYFDIFN